jgi:Flp pilus assembly protein TadG
MIPTKTRTRQRQSGHIFIEFALVSVLFLPLMVGTFITGINIVRSVQVNHMARDLADMYIHGADFSDLAMQQVAKRLGTGLGLDVGSATSGNNANNTSNAGYGMVWISKVIWVGPTNQPLCQSVVPATCTNANKFVVLEQVRFGKGSLESYRDTTIGHPTAARDTYGRTGQNYVTDATYTVPEPYQTALYNLWQVSTTATARTALVDGQQIYMAEVYFRHAGSFGSNGVYARWFF